MHIRHRIFIISLPPLVDVALPSHHSHRVLLKQNKKYSNVTRQVLLKIKQTKYTITMQLKFASYFLTSKLA